MRKNPREDLCRICYNDSFLYSNIYDHHQVVGKKILDLVEDLFRLDMSNQDGFPQHVCCECHKKISDFELLKRTAHQVNAFIISSNETFRIHGIKRELESAEDEDVERSEHDIKKEIEMAEDEDVSNANESEDDMPPLKLEESDTEEEMPDRVSCFPDNFAAQDETNCARLCINEEISWNKERADVPILRKTIGGVSKECAENNGGNNYMENCDEGIVIERNEYKRRTRSSTVKENLTNACDMSDCKESISECHDNDSKPSELNIVRDVVANAVSQENTDVEIVEEKNVLERVIVSEGTNSSRKRKRSTVKRFFCDVCKKGFVCKSDLGLHSIVHTRIRPYVCSICGKGFVRRSYLDVHINLHSDEKPHVCSLCGKAFKVKNYLTLHMKTHSSNDPYCCDICGKVFSIKKSFDFHMRCHTDKVCRYPCVECGKRFNCILEFIEHRNKDHIAATPFGCRICGRHFATKANLLRHHMTHEDFRPHCCPTCKKSFKSITSLKKHVATHSSVKAHKCSTCGRSFRLLGQLRKHETFHKTERPFKCPNCNNCFKCVDYLKHHIKFYCKSS